MENYQAYQRELLEVAREAPYRDSPLQARTEQAFLAYPRHLFIKRFKSQYSGWIEINQANLDELLPVLYQDTPLLIKEDTHSNPISTISQPSFVLYMLDLLRLEEGQRVFELGAGSGWNAALLSYLVGERGRVYSSEIIPEVAELAKENIQQLKIKNLTIHEGDGIEGLKKYAPFDRVIFTAGGYDLPRAIFESVKAEGLVLCPIKIKGGPEILYLLQKQNDYFEAIRSMDSAFVQLTGKHRIENMEPIIIEEMPEWDRVKARYISETPLWLGKQVKYWSLSETKSFRFFLSINEPAFILLKKEQAKLGINGLGLWLADQESLVIVEDDHLIVYGNEKARERFLDLLHQWLDLGMPSATSYTLKVFPIAKDLVVKERQWLIKRAAAQFWWALPEA